MSAADSAQKHFGNIRSWLAAASKLANRPVRIALSREGVYRVVGGRSLTEQRVAIGSEGGRPFYVDYPYRNDCDDAA